MEDSKMLDELIIAQTKAAKAQIELLETKLESANAEIVTSKQNEIQIIQYASELRNENKKLSEANTKLRAALEFYADANNWLEIEGTDGCREQIRNDSFKHANGYSLGGKIAREALSEPVKTGDSLQTDESKDGGK